MATARDRRAEADAVLAERRSMLDKARQAERIAAERDTATERYERYKQAVEVHVQIQALATTHPSPNPVGVLRGGVERLRALDSTIHELQGDPRQRDDGRLRARAGTDLATPLAHLGRAGR